jgi:hypothetical protein
MATQAKPGGGLVKSEIVDWRLAQLLRAGYGSEHALTIAVRTEVDLHRAVALVRAGCPPETALRILL